MDDGGGSSDSRWQQRVQQQEHQQQHKQQLEGKQQQQQLLDLPGKQQQQHAAEAAPTTDDAAAEVPPTPAVGQQQPPRRHQRQHHHRHAFGGRGVDQDRGRAGGELLWARLDPMRGRLLRAHAELGGGASGGSARLLELLENAGCWASPAHMRRDTRCAVANAWQRLAAWQVQQQQQQQQQQQVGQPPQHKEFEAQKSAAAGSRRAAAQLALKRMRNDAALDQRQRPRRPASASADSGGADRPWRPWQPKLQPDEPNWHAAEFAAVGARVADQLIRRSGGGGGSGGSGDGSGGGGLFAVGRALPPPHPLPDQASARVVALVMLHGAGWPNHLFWERWAAAHEPGAVSLCVHMKAGVELSPGLPGCEAIQRHALRASVAATWGDISLVQAQLESLTEVLQRCPSATHIAIASGHDVPVQKISPSLLQPGVSLFGAYQFGEVESRTLKIATVDALVANASLSEGEAQAWGQALTFHHQWMVLSREHASALVSLAREILVVGRVIHRACNAVRAGMAPDEFVLVTALRAHGYVRSVTRVEVVPGMSYPPGCLLNSYPTLVLFPAEPSPHPITWTSVDHRARCQVERHSGSKYAKELSLRECLDTAMARRALFFRKVELRRTNAEEVAVLLSILEAMWERQRGAARRSAAAAQRRRHHVLRNDSD